MADKLSRQPQNLPEPWYVDTTCALCRLCLGGSAEGFELYQRRDRGLLL